MPSKCHLRMKIRRVIHLLVIFTVLNVMICVILYNMLEVRRAQFGQAASWFYEEYLYSEQPCYTEEDFNVKDLTESVEKIHHINNSFMCISIDQSVRDTKSDIVIEEEMDALRISYPDYIIAVSGFLQLVKVNSWNVKRLKVIIMPHSHQDPGWKNTFQRYFLDFGKNTLNNMITFLSKNQNTKFIWSEMVILSEWWKQADRERKNMFKKLVESGQVEITPGGWIMTDEGTTHYTAMLDQLIEGHQWLKQNLAVEPNTSWSVDPFGHSPTMAYLLKQSNIKSMVIQRVHYSIKQHLAKQKNFEFQWRQGWASDDSTDILCHMMPFLSYAIQYSCGPDPHICCQYDFFYKQCYYGNKKVNAVPVDNINIDFLATQLWEQFQKKAELYKTGVILVPYGDDFRFSSPSEWEKQIGNMEKLMKYINSKPYFQTEIKFGTLSDYFDEVSKTNTIFPTLSGDFFTYSDRGKDYWSGYYTSRPHYKHVIRRMQDFLRSLEILFSYSLAAAISKKKQTIINTLMGKVEDLSNMRQQVALFQHHDAITGTSTHKVMDDYGKRLHSGYQKATALLETLMTYNIYNTTDLPSEVPAEKIYLNSEWTRHENFIEPKIIDISKPRQILLYNSLGSKRHSVVKLHINKQYIKVISMATRIEVPHQISPVIESDVVKENIFELSFIVAMPGLSISKYIVVPLSYNPYVQYIAEIKIIVDESKNLRFNKFTQSYSNKPKFFISNDHLTATFYTCDGRLQYITKHNSTRFKSEVKLMTYGTGSWTNPLKDKSGAYIFLPDGHAKNLQEAVKSIYVVNGAVYSSVVVKFTSVTQIYTLHKTIGSDGRAIHIENIVNLTNGTTWNNKELVMRVVTGVRDKENHLCVDLNGFQMHRKKTRKKLSIQGNFYPMTSTAFIETDIDRVTLISSETHGVSSLSPGWLEVVLDRRLIQDDWRGLSQGITDNVVTRSQFVILFERKPVSNDQNKDLMCYPSATAKIITRQMENQIIGMNSASITRHDWTVSSATHWDIDIVNLRFLRMEENCLQLLLIVHHSPYDCSLSVAEPEWNLQAGSNRIQISSMFEDSNVTTVEQTTLTGTRIIRTVPRDTNIEINKMDINTFKLTIC